MKLYQKFALAGVLATGAVAGSDAAFAQASYRSPGRCEIHPFVAAVSHRRLSWSCSWQPAFAMLEAGLVRSKNVSMQCLKNIALYSVAGLMFWVVGYNLMYDGRCRRHRLDGNTDAKSHSGNRC